MQISSSQWYQVNEMKYLLKCQYWNCQFSNVIDTHGMYA